MVHSYGWAGRRAKAAPPNARGREVKIILTRSFLFIYTLARWEFGRAQQCTALVIQSGIRICLFFDFPNILRGETNLFCRIRSSWTIIWDLCHWYYTGNFRWHVMYQPNGYMTLWLSHSWSFLETSSSFHIRTEVWCEWLQCGITFHSLVTSSILPTTHPAPTPFAAVRRVNLSARFFTTAVRVLAPGSGQGGSAPHDLHALLQDHGRGRTRLVQCGSRFLADAETRYTTIELDLLAVVWALSKCRFHLIDLQNFTLTTDHRPLVPILNVHTLDTVENPRLQRLKEKTSPYLFTAVWRAGKQLCIPSWCSVNSPS